MTQNIQEIADRIISLPADWHGAGTVSNDVIKAIARHASEITIKRSVESGAGRTTLLMSHLSQHHTVFAIDLGNSVTRVRDSPLLRKENVTFVEGPTQRTIPAFQFGEPVQFALIDGPHGYPFPDLEYYYLYPHIESGGLLLIDDINIPSIGRMFEIIRADEMFSVIDVVSNTAFLRRTSAPSLDPFGCSWYQQGYNKAFFQELMNGPNTLRHRLIRGVSRAVPDRLKAAVPRTWKQRFSRLI